jgi:hypothetical protein
MWKGIASFANDGQGLLFWLCKCRLRQRVALQNTTKFAMGNVLIEGRHACPERSRRAVAAEELDESKQKTLQGNTACPPRAVSRGLPRVSAWTSAPETTQNTALQAQRPPEKRKTSVESEFGGRRTAVSPHNKKRSEGGDSQVPEFHITCAGYHVATPCLRAQRRP